MTFDDLISVSSPENLCFGSSLESPRRESMLWVLLESPYRNLCCGFSLESPRQAILMRTHNIGFY